MRVKSKTLLDSRGRSRQRQHYELWLAVVARMERERERALPRAGCTSLAPLFFFSHSLKMANIIAIEKVVVVVANGQALAAKASSSSSLELAFVYMAICA